MIDEQSVDRVVTVMKNCSVQLRRAHTDLNKLEIPVDPLLKIEGVADALDSLAVDIEGALRQASRTTAGLSRQVDSLRRANAALDSRAIERL